LLVKKDGAGVTAIVQYPDNRRGIVELNEGAWVWGGELRTKEKSVPFVVNMDYAYRDLLREVEKFFRTGVSPADLADTLEVMALLDAARRSTESGAEEAINL
jgi:hypothetical protein